MIVSEIRVAGFGRLAVCAELVADFFHDASAPGLCRFKITIIRSSRKTLPD
jgi:hypothetical protein